MNQPLIKRERSRRSLLTKEDCSAAHVRYRVYEIMTIPNESDNRRRENYSRPELGRDVAIGVACPSTGKVPCIAPDCSDRTKP